MEEITAGVDWITIISDTRRESDQLAESVVELGRMERASGASVKPFRFMGYTGQMCGGVRLGFKGPAAVAQLSGELCRDSWTRLASSPGRVTRLDLQTTLRLSRSQTEFARSLLKPSAKTHRTRRVYRPQTHYSSGTSGLRIGTVGRRTHRSYARVYDKGVESKTAPPGHLWRIELECKLDLGAKLWETLKKSQDVPAFCYGTCESQWRQWGLSWRLPASSKQLVVPDREKRKPAPAHVLAAWLRSSVAPTIPRILTTYSVTEVLEALGMEHLAIARGPEAEHGER